MNIYLLIFITLNSVWTINCLKCYTCSAVEFDQRCVTDVESAANVINCQKKYCTSIRVEYLDPKGKVQSMIRTCEDEPVYLNEIIEDGSFKIYYTACQEDLCNGGEGKDTSASNMLNIGQGYGVLLVRGSGGAGDISPSFTSKILPILFFLYKSVL